MQSLSRNLLPLFMLILLSACSSNSEQKNTEATPAEENTEMEAINYTLDTDKSVLMWEGTMMGMYSHEGTLDFTEGSFKMNGDEVVDGSFTVDMMSMTPTDENFDPEAGKTADKLVGHLQSDDFFNVAEFKTASLSVENGQMMLTVRDQTHPIELKEFNPTMKADLLEADGKFIFDRKKFNVSFDHPAQDMVLSDDIEVEFKITAFRD
ncbi:MAG: YceI family protein [Flavobacteriales bacterium]|nr:YceI family protein [Flavobacteriales bacterium]